MSKVIQDYGLVRCICVEPVNKLNAMSWSRWRRQYIGREGRLRLYESEKRHPGFLFLNFIGAQDPASSTDEWLAEGWCLKTSYGKGSVEQEMLTFCTVNTRYVFRLERDTAARLCPQFGDAGNAPNDEGTLVA